MACGRLSTREDGICANCRPPYTRAWCVGLYDEGLKDLIHGFKFERAKSNHKDLVDLLDKTLPVLPNDLTVTYVTTLSSHRRLRGYDHVRLVARVFAKRRGLKFETALERQGKTQQRGVGAELRWRQAKIAYASNKKLTGRYLLIDDVVTTGATLHYASKTLLDAGASEVWVAAIARQSLD